MSEAERRHTYRSSRILIETARILDPQFDDEILSLSGAQVELLRNIVAYLNRETTFVTTYYEGYYLSPTVEQWDSLSAIIADLERVLMGNNNTVWGYKDRLFYDEDIYPDDAGTFYLLTPVVPAGEIHVPTVVDLFESATEVEVTISTFFGGQAIQVVNPQTLAVDAWLTTVLPLVVLKAGDRLIIKFADCSNGDLCGLLAVGYTMEVPI